MEKEKNERARRIAGLSALLLGTVLTASMLYLKSEEISYFDEYNVKREMYLSRHYDKALYSGAGLIGVSLLCLGKDIRRNVAG